MERAPDNRDVLNKGTQPIGGYLSGRKLEEE